jgi:hypothetical protein
MAGDFSGANHLAQMQPDPLDLDSFMMDQTRPPHLDAGAHHTPPMIGNPQFANFSFQYPPQMSSPMDSATKTKLEPSASPYNLAAPAPGSDHRSSITSIPPQRASFSGNLPLSVHAVSNDGSEDASPESGRLGRGSIAEGLTDEFGIGGLEGDMKAKEDKDGNTPAWSELKTKAGKERKRLPLACIACRRKKIRCSGEKPACKHCLRSRIPCVYKVTTRKAAPRTDYMAMLDKRLKRMEERIIKIVPKEDQNTSIVRAQVKPALPGTIATKPVAKKRTADEAFSSELDTWAKSSSNTNTNTNSESTSKPTSLLLQEQQENRLLTEGAEALPSREIQEHLAEVFFENVNGQTYHLLHKPSFMRKLRCVLARWYEAYAD